MSNDAEPPVYSVAELNTLVNNALTTHIGSVLVEGEVTGFMLRQGRWATFDLRDPESSINCFVIRQKLHTGIEDGMRVRILGSPRIYVPYGKYSLNVTALQPVGEGALRRAYELLKRRLEAEGIFGKQHKRVPPAFPESIGLITSAEGAALGDVRRISTYTGTRCSSRKARCGIRSQGHRIF